VKQMVRDANNPVFVRVRAALCPFSPLPLSELDALAWRIVEVCWRARGW
jgi:hypothetical protein